jgi:hypothetical protein
MRKCLVTLSLEKPGENAEEILTTCELFICGDIHYVSQSLCKDVLKTATPYIKL